MALARYNFEVFGHLACKLTWYCIATFYAPLQIWTVKKIATSFHIFPEIAIEFKFLILVAAFPSLSSKHAELIRTHITGVPCLHIYGKGDEVISNVLFLYCWEVLKKNKSDVPCSGEIDIASLNAKLVRISLFLLVLTSMSESNKKSTYSYFWLLFIVRASLPSWSV